MEPGIWGPSAWALLHSIAENATPGNAAAVHKLFGLLDRVLPCPRCQGAYAEHIRLLPVPTDHEEFGRWTYELHNRVNITKRIPLKEWPAYESVKRKYRGPGPSGRLRSLHGRDVWKFLAAVALVCKCVEDFWKLLPAAIEPIAPGDAKAMRAFLKSHAVDKKNMVDWAYSLEYAVDGRAVAPVTRASCDVKCAI